MALQITHQRGNDGGHDPGRDHRENDRMGQGQQPDRACQKCRHTDEQPRHHTKVAEPPGRGEDPGKLAGIDLYELRLLVTALAVALPS
jgi:hypothetical protein